MTSQIPRKTSELISELRNTSMRCFSNYDLSQHPPQSIQNFCHHQECLPMSFEDFFKGELGSEWPFPEESPGCSEYRGAGELRLPVFPCGPQPV